MMFEISHRTHYTYSAPVAQSQHLVHMSPRAAASATVHRHTLLVDPAPIMRKESVDPFGNPVVLLDVEVPHSEFIVHARTLIENRHAEPLDFSATTPWDAIPPPRNIETGEIDLDVIAYRSPTWLTDASLDIADYARQSFTRGRPVFDAAHDLTMRVFKDFTFDATATDVSTPITEVFHKRRGVCQDFAHFALACCRALRVPARYVSGYILTQPPPGQPKLQGTDASHAWISVWAPVVGWYDFDPTNGTAIGQDHIAFACGRDYNDVSPISGVLIGGGAHKVEVAVDVAVV